MKLGLSADATKMRDRLSRTSRSVLDAQRSAGRGIVDSIVSRARALASGDLANIKSGRYLESIHGTLRADDRGVAGYIVASAPEAILLEVGAVRRAATILPNSAQVLSFMVDGRHVFARSVKHPASIMQPRPVLETAIEQMGAEVVTKLKNATHAGLTDGR